MMFTFIHPNPRNIRMLAIMLNLERVSRICFCEICFIEPKDRLKQVGTILNIVNITVLYLVAELCLSLCNPTDHSLPGSSVYGDSPGKNIGMGCHFLLQGIFPTQGSNPGDLPNPGIQSRSPALKVDSLPSEPPTTEALKKT